MRIIAVALLVAALGGGSATSPFPYQEGHQAGTYGNGLGVYK